MKDGEGIGPARFAVQYSRNDTIFRRSPERASNNAELEHSQPSPLNSEQFLQLLAFGTQTLGPFRPQQGRWQNERSPGVRRQQ